MKRRLGTELTKLKVILCAHKLDTLGEMDSILRIDKLAKLTQESKV